jgi:DNA-binding transcriptional LysR family regulator
VEFSDLKYLLAVAEAGSISGAARFLNLHASTLSRHIFSVEEELGTTIFLREHSGVRLTSSGQDIIIYARQTLADLEALTRVARASGIGRRGTVRLGIHIPPISSYLMELLCKWRQSHHEVTLSLCEYPDGELCKAVRDHQLDAVLVAEYALAPDLVGEFLYSERLTAAVSDRSSLSRQAPISWAALRKEPILVQDWPQSHLTRAFYGELIGHGTHFHPHAVSKQSLLALVASGFGITLATESQAKAGFSGVSFMPISEETAAINIVLAWMPQSEDQTVGRFIAFMRDEARSLRSR